MTASRSSRAAVPLLASALLLAAPAASRFALAAPGGEAAGARPAPRPLALATAPAGALHGREGAELLLRIDASDPAGGRVTVRLLNPPPGARLRPLAGAARPGSSAEVRWSVPPGVQGVWTLAIEAKSSSGASGMLAVPVRISGLGGPAVRTGDVTGDAVPDVVGGARQADVGGVANAGAIHVWAGGASVSTAPSASLTVPGASPGDLLGLSSEEGLQLADVTGDGVLDVVAVAQHADLGAFPDSGAVYVWAGGALAGAVAPTAVLERPFHATSDQLGESGVRFADVTGDGVTDVVVGTSLADVNGVTNAGTILVFEGGPGLAGSPAPHSELAVSSAVANDRLGHASGAGFQLVDVSGDGIADVLAGASQADVAGLVNFGAAYVWFGGRGGGGATWDPDVFLYAVGPLPLPANGDQMGDASGQAIQVGDVSGDGIADVVIGARFAEGDAVADAGAIYVWEGNLQGGTTPIPDHVLTAPNAAPGDRLGESSGQGILLVDLSGDGIDDVVAGAQQADHNGVTNSGRVCVWRGGNLNSPAASFGDGTVDDQLGRASGQGILTADVNGDGRLDLLVGAILADAGPSSDAGAVYVWDGDAGFDFDRAPDLVITGSGDGERLGDTPGQGILTADVTADGVLDVVIGSPYADGFLQDTGEIQVWRGVVGSLPTFEASLADFSAEVGDRLGSAAGQGILIGDVSGDGRPELIAGAQYADAGGVVDAGALHVWRYESGSFQHTRLEVPGAEAGDRLGEASGFGIQLADLDDDGIDDLVVGARLADVGGVSNAGAVHLFGWLFGSLGYRATLLDPGLGPNDQLGFSADGIQFADVTGDGVLDLLVGAQLADEGAVNDGAIHLWTGGPGILISPAPETLSVPGAASGDQLGG